MAGASQRQQISAAEIGALVASSVGGKPNSRRWAGQAAVIALAGAYRLGNFRYELAPVAASSCRDIVLAMRPADEWRRLQRSIILSRC
jgi:hypothetical protein